MKRIVAFVVLVALAVGAGLYFAGEDDATGLGVAAGVERRLQRGDVVGARREVDATRGRIPPWRTDYLEALLLFREQRQDAALPLVLRAFRSAPEDWRVVSLVFYTLVRNGRTGEAWQALDGYLGRHPRDDRALACAAQYWIVIRADRPDPDRAAEYLRRLEALDSPAVPPDDLTAVTSELVEQIRGAIEAVRGQVQTAVLAARKRVADAPQNADAHAQLGDALRRAGDWPGAAAALRDAVRLAPTQSRYAEQLALVLLEIPEAAEEVDAVTAALFAERGKESSIAVLRARAVVRAGRIDEAIDIYRALLGTDLGRERRKEVLRNLAVALYDWRQGGREGDYLDEAHRLLGEYVKLGGEIDERLCDTWTTLEQRAARKASEPPR